MYVLSDGVSVPKRKCTRHFGIASNASELKNTFDDDFFPTVLQSVNTLPRNIRIKTTKTKIKVTQRMSNERTHGGVGEIIWKNVLYNDHILFFST